MKISSEVIFFINIVTLNIPPLRERTEDIPLLCKHFAKIYSKKTGKEFKALSKDSIEDLKHYEWPGNIRELQNIIERAAILLKDGILRPIVPEIIKSKSTIPSNKTKLVDVEKEHILKILNETKGIISGPKGAAVLLSLNPSTLRSRMEKLGIKIN